MEHYLLSLKQAFERGFLAGSNLVGFNLQNLHYSFPNPDAFLADLRKLLPPAYSSTPFFYLSPDVSSQEFKLLPVSHYLTYTLPDLKGMSGEEWITLGRETIATSLREALIPGWRKMWFGYLPKAKPLTHIGLKFLPSSVINYLMRYPSPNDPSPTQIFIDGFFFIHFYIREEGK